MFSFSDSLQKIKRTLKRQTTADIIYLALALLIYIVIGFCFALWSNNSTKKDIMLDVDKRLLKASKSIEHVLGPDFHDRTISADAISPYEDRINSIALENMAKDLDLAYILTLVRIGDAYHQTASNLTSAEAPIDYTYFKQTTDLPERLYYHTYAPVYNIKRKHENIYRQIYMPQISASGRSYLICAAYDISYMQSSLTRAWINSSVTVAIFTLLPLSLLIFYLSTYRRITNRLQAEVDRHKQEETILRDAEAILQSVSHATQQFLSPGEWNLNIQEVLRHLGQATGVSRVHIYKNYTAEDGRLLITHRYEWAASDVSSILNDGRFNGIPYREVGLARWEEVLGHGRIISGNLEDFPLPEKKALSDYDIISMIAVPIIAEDQWWGFISFDDCKRKHNWSEMEIDALCAATSTLKAAIERKHAEEAIRLNESRLESLLKLDQLTGFNKADLAEFALNEEVKLTKSRCGYIVMLDENEQFETIHFLENNRFQRVEASELLRHPELATPWQEIKRSRKAIIANNLKMSNQTWLPESRERIIRHINIPVHDGERLVAIAGVANKESSYSDSDVTQLTLLIQGLWRLIQRSRSAEERSRLATAVEQAAETIIITDFQGIIEYVNPAFERITGYTRDEAIGQNASMIIAGEGSATLFSTVWQAARNEAFWQGRNINIKKDGSLYQVENTISPIFDSNGRVINFVSVQRDVSHEIALEAQLRQAQKMEAMGTLAGGIAHDFNNILSAIMGYTELAMIDMNEQSSSHQRLNEVLKAGRRATDLVKQILTFSRQTEHERKPMQLQPVIKEALKLLRGSLPTTIELKYNIHPDCGAVLADPTRMHQVIMNLCTNAFHAMQGPGGIINVTLQQQRLSPEEASAYLDLEPGSYACLSVSDNGHGMDEQTIERIFEPYFTTKDTGKGTGLGLATVHGIVKSHDGDIKVESQPGKGTRFEIFLPICSQADSQLDEAAASSELPGGHEHILFVDDEDILVDMEQTILSQLGYKVSAFTSSQEALDHFKEDPGRFDLVITDHTMPRLTGSDLAKAIHAIRPELPIILCSGFSDVMTEEELKAVGIREYIPKPLITEQLARAIRAVLK